MRRVFLGCVICITLAYRVATATTLAEQRADFQHQELVTARPFTFIFTPGEAPRIVWRDVDHVRQLGCDGKLSVRWFDAELKEAKVPDRPGRWGAYVEGVAPNGTPIVRSMTFFARPKDMLFFTAPGAMASDYQPSAVNPDVWREHASEIADVAGDARFRGFNDSERGAILFAGLTEMKPLGRAAMSFESALARNEAFHLAIRMKAQGLCGNVRPLSTARKLATSAPILREGTPAEAGVTGDAKARIDAVCRAWVEDSKEPFVTLVARHGVIITHEAFGCDPRTGQPITRDYRADVASITKTITATLFARFVDQGLVDFDDPVSKVFPNYPTNSHVPTFRQCLTHMSGLSGHGEFNGVHNPHLDNVILNAIDVNEPGKAYNYSGAGFDLTAKAMELLSGTGFARLYFENLFEPLGAGDLPMGGGASGAQPTANQLGIVAQLLCNKGRYGNAEFFSEATFERMLPEDLSRRYPGATTEIEGIGMHWMHPLKPGATAPSTRPSDFVLSARTIGHGSLSSSMFLVDLDRELVIVQLRRTAGPRFDHWSPPFLQTVVQCLRD